MLGLFEAFSLKCTQLKQAIASGQDELVCLLDKELEPLIADILAFKATTPEDAQLQMQFLNGLIRDSADDRSSVMRRTASMAELIDRYFLAFHDGATPSVFQKPNRKTASDPVDQPLLNEAILNSLPDRVVVVTTDYRYLYSNLENARYLNTAPLSMIGRHVSEYLDEESFRSMAKPALDRCFAGHSVDYIHEGFRNGEGFTTRCRMTPLFGVDNRVIGAVVVLQEAEKLRELEHN